MAEQQSQTCAKALPDLQNKRIGAKETFEQSVFFICFQLKVKFCLTGVCLQTPEYNYDYDNIGNLIKDAKEGITQISWTVYGKIETISKAGNTTIQYSYDAAGNRINKTVNQAGNTNTTVYVRDAQGNTLSVYEQNSTLNSGHFTQSELHLYGSSRLGIYNLNKDLTLTPPANTNLGSGNSGGFGIFERNKKFFELSNHLGNVLVTVSDEKIGIDLNNDGIIDYYTAGVVSAGDYYPFGMGMPGRKYDAGSYRYGFNGKENDNEVKGEGNQIDYGMRVYDPRLGRFLSVDPLAHKFPWQSPYCAMDNNPVNKIDPTGMAATSPIYGTDGKFLGTDDQGLQGKAIVMKQEDFTQGMKHEDAMKKDLAPNGGSEYYKAIPSYTNYVDFYNHYNNLPNRPDYDGFVNIREGIDWAKSHVGALQNPTPENMLYINASKLDFGNITISDFKNGVGKSSPINLNTPGNFAAAQTNYTLASTVYALGRVNITLLNNSGSVKIVNDFNLPFGRATDYDWNKGGSIWRKGLINYERWSEGLNDTHGFRTFYYGTGQLRP